MHTRDELWPIHLPARRRSHPSAGLRFALGCTVHLYQHTFPDSLNDGVDHGENPGLYWLFAFIFVTYDFNEVLGPRFVGFVSGFLIGLNTRAD